MDEQEKIVEAQTVIDAGMSNPPLLTDLKADLTRASQYHSQYLAKLETWRAQFSLAKPLKTRKGKSGIQPKLIRKQAEWTYPDISEPFLSTPNFFDAVPNSSEDETAAEQNKLIINRQFKTQINRTRLMDAIARSLVDDGTAILRTSWDFQERVTDVTENTYNFIPVHPNSPQGQQLQQFIQMAQSGEDVSQAPEEMQVSMQASLRAKQLVLAEVSGTKVVKKKDIVKNQPVVEVVDLESCVADPNCRGDFSQAQFIVWEFEISKSDMRKQSGRYHNIDALPMVGDESAEGKAFADASRPHTDYNFKDDARRLHKAKEYWGYADYDGTGIAESFVMTWIDDVIVRLEKNPIKENGLPFVNIQYMPNFKSNHGEPDGELINENQKIVGATMRGMIDVMARSANGQVGYRSDALDTTNAARFKSGLDFEYRPNVDPRTMFHLFKFDELPSSSHQMLQLQQKEAESLSGTQPFGSEGIKNTNSAQGVRNILDATSKRRMSILRRVSRGLVEVGKKVIAMNQSLLSEEEIVRITDNKFVNIKREDLRGDFDLSLEISTAEHDDSKASELAFMLQTDKGADPGESRMIRGEIARLRNMPDFADRIESFEPTPDPLMVKEQELKIQLLEAQIANEYAKAHENQANGDRDNEMVNTEKAKQRKLLAEADNIDLSYVERETGTEQERKKELAFLNHISKAEQINLAGKNKPQQTPKGN